MYKKIAFLCVIIILSSPILSFASYDLYNAEQLSNIKLAMKFAEKQDWNQAYSYANKVKDKTIVTAIHWLKVRQDTSNENFSDIKELLTQVHDWPDARTIRIRAEQSIDLSVSNTKIIEFFAKNPPISSDGKKTKLKAIYNLHGFNNEVISYAKNVWIECNFSKKEEKDFLALYGKYISENDYHKKVDRLFWQDMPNEGIKYIAKINKNYQLVFNARYALINNKSNVEHILKTVPTSYQNDPGLLYDKIIWYERNKEDFNGLVNLMHNIPLDPPYYEKWWKFKSRHIRSLIEKKQYQTAYKLTSNHKNESNSDYAEAEWLAGWIALRYLHKPDSAIIHFKKMYKTVKLPISVAKATYWAGRSVEETGDNQKAKDWYKISALYPTTFYGQLAVIKINEAGEFDLEDFPKITEEDKINFNKNNFARLAFSFSYYRNGGFSRQFIAKAISHAKSKGEMALIANLGLKLKKHDLALEASKHASYKMTSLTKFCYPTLKMNDCGDVEQAFVHALIRQESMFDPNAESSAGALGLMQIMPSTGKMIASAMKTKFNESKLKSDLKYNFKLGVYHLNQLVNQFKGSYILTAASYNAGSHNAKDWIKRFGDPREMNKVEDVIDWIESITFYETRNYVQRVLESTQIYRSVINHYKPHKTTIKADILRNQK